VLAHDGDRADGVVVDGVDRCRSGPRRRGALDADGHRPDRALATDPARWGVVVETLLPDGPRHVLEEAEIGEAIGTDQPAPESIVDGVADAPASETDVDFSFVPLDGVASSARRSSPTSRHQPTGSSRSSPMRPGSSRPSPTRPSAARGRARDRRASTGAR
jgi:hypothetical protein